MSEKKLVLEGLKVVSFCHYLQGPAAMQYLADMGAEVIKIEPPRGAFERHWAGAGTARVGGVSALYLCANRNVRSLALDLKHPDSRAVVFRLIAGSHVVAENFRPKTLDRLGFGYEAVRERKPDIIYASASGFGASGPYATRPGQDLLVQAMSGMVATGGGGPVPVPVGITAADQHGAALLAMAIAGAYARWLQTGVGTRIETTLFGAAVDLQAESIVTYHASGLGPRGLRRDPHLATWFHEAPYGIYAIKDGFIALSITSLEALSAALENPALAAMVGCDAFAERDRIAALTAEAVAGRNFSELAAAFEAAGVWYARVDDYDALRTNPQAVHNRVFQELPVNGATATLVNHPVRYDGEPPPPPSMSLAPGADTREILEQAGFSAAEFRDLVRNGVVATPEDTP
jgi:crotonobetainyl-CoA:carnitine CoA-transferase CaiB-like acyl-CoA transferase